MKYKLLKEAALGELVNEDWEGTPDGIRHQRWLEMGQPQGIGKYMRDRYEIDSGLKARKMERIKGHSEPSPSVKNFKFEKRKKQYQEGQRKRDEEIDKFVKMANEMAELAKQYGETCTSGYSDHVGAERMEKIYNALKDALAVAQSGVDTFNKNAAHNAGWDEPKEDDEEKPVVADTTPQEVVDDDEEDDDDDDLGGIESLRKQERYMDALNSGSSDPWGDATGNYGPQDEDY